MVQLVFRVINSVGAFFKRGRSFSRVFIPDRGEEEFLTMTDFKSGDFLEKKKCNKKMIGNSLFGSLFEFKHNYC